MKCLHCNHEIYSRWGFDTLREEVSGVSIQLRYQFCPNCDRIILEVDEGTTTIIVYPEETNIEMPDVVPSQIAQDFVEAKKVLKISPKASAALSRRCLQVIIREKYGIKEKSLDAEIQKMIDSRILPSSLADNVDAIRNVGNFAAHPIKSTSTGEIVPVEAHEASWNLDVLEELIDFSYVREAKDKAKRDALNIKLADAGKKPVKTT